MLSNPLEERYDEVFPGSNYTADETEFILAIDRYKATTGRRFLTWHEVLRIVRALGYRKLRPDGTPREGAD